MVAPDGAPTIWAGLGCPCGPTICIGLGWCAAAPRPPGCCMRPGMAKVCWGVGGACVGDDGPAAPVWGAAPPCRAAATAWGSIYGLTLSIAAGYGAMQGQNYPVWHGRLRRFARPAGQKAYWAYERAAPCRLRRHDHLHE